MEYLLFNSRQVETKHSALNEQRRLHQRPLFPKRLFGAYLSRLVPIPHLIYMPLDRLSR